MAEKVEGVVGEKTHHDIVESKKNGTYCGDCYGAKNGCCNTCEEVQKAYEEVKWTLKDLENYQQVLLTFNSSASMKEYQN